MKLPEKTQEEKIEKKKESCKIEVAPACSEKAEAIIQKGIKTEQDSAQIYEAMSAVADSLGYSNTSKFFKIHAQEERKHSDWVIKFLEDKNICPELPQIDKPEANWKSIKDILEGAYEHEEFVTNFWNDAASVCLRVGDHDAYQFCLFVLKEQREEIELFSSLIDLYNLSEGDSQLAFDSKIVHP